MPSSPPALDLTSRADFAINLARTVGRAASAFRTTATRTGLRVENKGPQDFVTIADRQSEDTIRTALKGNFPEDGFLGEETGGISNTDATWVVDPIDGTTNFMRGFSHWGVSIAFVSKGQLAIGAIYDGTSDSVYSATAGQGAFKDDKQIFASPETNPELAIAMVGHSRRTSFEDYISVLETIHAKGMDYRRMGAAAIALIRVAEGTADLYYERHLNSWDVLAGALIAKEAGADIFLPRIADALTNGGPVVASAAGLKQEFDFLRDLVRGDCVDL